MRLLLQRVRRASVRVGGSTVGSIDTGLCVFVGITHNDTIQQAQWLAQRCLDLRVFPDDGGRMNRSLLDTGGGLLLVSQFTLYADVRKGTRPSYVAAAQPEHALPLFDAFVHDVRRRADEAGTSITVATGVFGAMMEVDLVNDGPVTILLEREAPAAVSA